eukprot:gene6048-2665_t
MSLALAEDETHLSTQTIGTVSHMAPELLSAGKLSPAADLYAFGICAWELFCGKPAYSGMYNGQIVERVVVEKLRPRWSPWVPAAYQSMIEDCWAHDPSTRPSFLVVANLIITDLLVNVDTLQAE